MIYRILNKPVGFRGAFICYQKCQFFLSNLLQICELERKIEISLYWFMLLLYVYFLNICFARFMVMLRGVTHLDHEKGFGIYVFHNIFFQSQIGPIPEEK